MPKSNIYNHFDQYALFTRILDKKITGLEKNSVWKSQRSNFEYEKLN